MNDGVLSGIKVLDFTQALSGPYVAWQFADLGAEVWKIERFHSGDQSRYYLPIVEEYNNQSTCYIAYNKNKKSAEINLSTPEGKDIIYKMAEKADVVIENFKSGTIDKLGFGYSKLKEINPKLVFLSMSGFGASGPLMKLPCYDAIAVARSGLAASSGDPEGSVVKYGLCCGDTMPGVYGFNAALMALIHARKTGKGCHIDLGMTDVLIPLCAEAFIDYSLNGSEQMRYGNHDRFLAPYGIFEARDGWVAIIADTEDRWKATCDVLGLQSFKSDARFVDNSARIKNKDELALEIEKVTSSMHKAEIEEKLLEAGVPCSKLYTFIEAYTSNHANAVHPTQLVYQEKAGILPFYTCPLKFNDERIAIRGGSPLLGKHTREILASIGYLEDEINEMYDKGIVDNSMI